MTASRRRLVLGAWAACTVVSGVQAWLTFWGEPNARLTALAAQGPGSNPYVTGIAVLLAWVTLGVALALLTSPGMTPARTVMVIGQACLALLYINVMRERTYYGDFDNYFHAASNLRAGVPLPERYLYPPLWASVLAPFTGLGEAWTFAFAWGLNLLSTIGSFLVLPKVLERYGFAPLVALGVTLLFGVVNVPILRTLGYAQINMLVLLAVLLALYWYPQHRLWSAAALALATHLKVSPIVIAAAFLWALDVRWLAWFGVALAAIGAWPGFAYGWTSYAEAFHNMLGMREVNGLAFREVSIDSFVQATGVATGLDLVAVIWPAKLALVAACMAVAATHRRHQTFVGAGAPGAAVLNVVPALLVAMVMASPLVWEHHPVLLALSYLVVGTVLTPADWPLFGIAWFLEFLMPTFDVYPWSYGRLLSPLILLALAWRRRGTGQSSIFTEVNRRLRAAADA